MTKNRGNKLRPTPSRRQKLLSAKMWIMWDALRRFATRTSEMHTRFNEASAMLPEETFRMPEPVSIVAWLFQNGAVVMLHSGVWELPRLDYWVVRKTLDATPVGLPPVPTPMGLLNMPFAFGRDSFGGVTILENCVLNTVSVPYAYITAIGEDDPRLSEPEQAALLDFRLAVLGHQTELVQLFDVVRHLEGLLAEFDRLLNDAGREEDTQRFLKDNPILLGPGSMVIAKQKLGEDFVTDFVLRSQNAVGYEYTLVEIEKPDHKLFTGTGDPSAALAHAERQTLDWAQWIEKDKAHLQNKLAGFETPKFKIIIGRARDLSEDQKGRLRAKNRSLKDTRILTYDDLAADLRELIASFRSLVQAAPGQASLSPP